MDTAEFVALVATAQAGGIAGSNALKKIIDFAITENRSFLARRARQILETKFRIRIIQSASITAAVGAFS
jgi:hypothetical protein